MNMKKMKRLVALALSVVMVLAMSVVAFAQNEGGTYNITAPANDNHVYEIYQIFTGDLDSSGETLSNVKWGENGIETTGSKVDETILTTLKNLSGTDKQKANAIKRYANLENPVAEISNGQVYQAAAGYYLIKDKESSVPEGDTNTIYIVKVVGNLTIEPKSAKPSFEKKIKDTNDTTGETSGWQDSADYDIGDQVPFQLKGTVATNYANYEKYYFAFHDKEESGLTFNPASVKVYVDGVEITTGFEVKTAEADKKHNDCTFEVVFSDLKKIKAVGANSVITVEYTSELNENAVLGNYGNVNEAKLEYSNNPNDEQNGTPSTGETPWDNVIVFTYKVVVNKYANSVSDSNKLPGAEFTLEKVDKDGKKTLIDVVKTDNGTKFTFKGLDDGDYILTETKTPDRYNTINPITFTVTATHIDWTIGERTDVLTHLNGEDETGEITFTVDKTEGSLSADVINKSGSTLPSTGGIGTTIFYVVGGILMAGAAVLLITKRRAEN